MKKITAIILAVLMVLSTAAAAMGEENRIWQVGDTGEKVTWIQTRLKELEYLDRAPSGTFDEETAEALKAFQQDHGLLKSGMADSITMKTLETATETRSDLASKWAWEYEDVCYEAAADSSMMKSYAMPMMTSSPMAAGGMRNGPVAWNTEEYTTFENNRFLSVATAPLSTFAADADTSSYALFRRKVLGGERVAPDSIRIEEMLNYFHYDYMLPKDGEPFGVTTEIGPCPWNEKTRLLLSAGAILLYILLQNLLTLPLALPALHSKYQTDALFQNGVDILVIMASMLPPFLLLSKPMRKITYHSDPLPLEKPQGGSDVLLTIPAGLMFCMAANLLTDLMVTAVSAFGVELSSPDMALPTGALGILSSVIRVVLMPALVEELCLRGVVMQNLRAFGGWFAVITSALCFGLMHCNLMQTPFAFTVGLALG